jgi:hypothetical protein
MDPTIATGVKKSTEERSAAPTDESKRSINFGEKRLVDGVRRLSR